MSRHKIRDIGPHYCSVCGHACIYQDRVRSAGRPRNTATLVEHLKKGTPDHPISSAALASLMGMQVTSLHSRIQIARKRDGILIGSRNGSHTTGGYWYIGSVKDETKEQELSNDP